MALDTYDNLVTAVGNWLDRDDLTSSIPDFIALMQAELMVEARFRIMVTRDAAFTIDARQVNVPSDFLEAKRLNLDTNNRLWKIEFVDMESLIGNYIPTAGKPEFFTTIGSEFEFNRTPDDTYTATLVYYARPTDISSTNSSNVVFAAYPNLYLYGALVQAEPFLGNDARMGTWKTMYQTFLNKAQAASDKAEHSGSGLTIKTNGPTA